MLQNDGHSKRPSRRVSGSTAYMLVAVIALGLVAILWNSRAPGMGMPCALPSNHHQHQYTLDHFLRAAPQDISDLEREIEALKFEIKFKVQELASLEHVHQTAVKIKSAYQQQDFTLRQKHRLQEQQEPGDTPRQPSEQERIHEVSILTRQDNVGIFNDDDDDDDEIEKKQQIPQQQQQQQQPPNLIHITLPGSTRQDNYLTSRAIGLNDKDTPDSKMSIESSTTEIYVQHKQGKKEKEEKEKEEKEKEDEEEIPAITNTPIDFPEYNTIPSKTHIQPYQRKSNDTVGRCKHWRAGNRTNFDLSILPQQVSVERIYASINGFPAGFGAQSLYYCNAAQRLGWTRALMGIKQPNGPGAKYFSNLRLNQVSLLCGADTWLGWKKIAVLQDDAMTSIVSHIWESPFDRASKLERFRGHRRSASELGCNYVKQGFSSESFDFSSQRECKRFFNLAQGRDSLKNTAWVVKTESRGRNVGANNDGAISMMTLEMLKRRYGTCAEAQPLLVQKYMHDMLLLDGRKWDARVYVLVASINPLVVYTFDIFHIRALLTKFVDPLEPLKKQEEQNRQDDTEMAKAMGAATIDSRLKVSKKKNKLQPPPKQPQQQPETPTLSLKDQYLSARPSRPQQQFKNRNNNPPPLEYDEHYLDPNMLAAYLTDAGYEPISATQTMFTRMQSVIEFVFHTSGEWTKGGGRFRIYGFDFIVNKDLEPVLIDINRSPQFPFRTAFNKDLVRSMFDEALEVVHQVQVGKGANTDTLPADISGLSKQRRRRVPHTRHFHLTYFQDELGATL